MTKPKTCPVCRDLFTPSLPLQKVCSPICAMTHTRNQKAKQAERLEREDRKATRAKLEKLKTRTQWANEAQAAVNRYVRLRDADEPCISCDKPATWDGQWHASHFRSRGAASAVRFHLWNIHKSCSICNNHKSGNLIEYEPRLMAKIGADRVDWLRTQNQLADYSIEYLVRLKKVFTKKANRLEARRK